jgi:deoxycytidine triphosphate deaminase
MAVWTGKEVAKHIESPPEVKINPNGVDLRISEVWKLPEEGIATIHGSIRKIEPDKFKIEADSDGFYVLPQGTYEIRVANKVNIPKNAVGLLFPRSTLNRLGIIKSESAIWDSGYSGFGTQTVRVTIQEMRIHRDECWFQLMFMDMKEEVDQVYNGHWQGERPVKL